MIYNKVICIVGERGSYKTCYAVSLAKAYAEQGINVFTNIDLFGINHKSIHVKTLIQFPDWLRDGVIIIDEAHTGTDSYKFLTKQVQEATKFITQIRKRKLNFIYITVDFSMIAKRLRDQTDLFFYTTLIKDPHAMIEVVDKRDNHRLLNRFAFDGSPYFSYYDTEQIIDESEKK